MSETEQEGEDRDSGKDVATESVFWGAEAGCCLLNAITVLALFLSVSVLLVK